MAASATYARGPGRSKSDVERSVAPSGPPLSFQRIIVIPLDKPRCFGGQTISNMFK